MSLSENFRLEGLKSVVSRSDIKFYKYDKRITHDYLMDIDAENEICKNINQRLKIILISKCCSK